MERRCATFLSLLLLLCFGAGAAYAQRTCSPLVPVNASAPPANLTTPCCDLQTALFAVADPHTAPLSEAPLSQMVYWWGVLVMHDLGLIPEADADWLQPPATPCDVAAAAVPANFSQCPGPPPGTANGATPELDASFLYGSSSATTSILRQHYHGYLEIQPSGELTRTCPGVERYAGPGQSPSQMPCAGDPRAASELQLLALQTLFVQFHNRLCDRIRGWEERLHDDDIFNRVRAIVTGIVQRITLEEWLPVMLGSAAATAVPPYRPPPRGAPRPYVLLEFAAALPPLLASMQSPRVLYSDQNQELSEIPLAAGFYAPSQLHRVLGNEGACTVVTGLLRDPLRRLGPTLPQPLMDASLPARTCTLAAALNLSSFRQLQGALRVGGGGGGGAGAGVGVYEGLAGEAHGHSGADGTGAAHPAVGERDAGAGARGAVVRVAALRVAGEAADGRGAADAAGGPADGELRVSGQHVDALGGVGIRAVVGVRRQDHRADKLEPQLGEPRRHVVHRGAHRRHRHHPRRLRHLRARPLPRLNPPS